jgi:hypothetical protein
VTEHVGHSSFKSALIVHVLAVVVTEALLIEVAKEMKWFDAHISPVDPALEKRPEVLKAVGVDAPVDVLDGVIHNLMSILPCQSLVVEEEVCIEGRAGLNMLLHFGLQRVLLAVRHNRCDDLAVTLKDAHHSNLVFRSRTSDATGSLRNVHVAGLATYEGFIGFNLTRQLGRCLMQGGTDTVKHEPSGLLSDAESASDLAGANAVLAVAENPVSAHPLIQSERGVFEDGPNLEAELLLASRAEPHAAGLNKGALLGTATRAANYTVRESQVERVLESTVSVREVDDGALQSVRGFHSSILGRIALCVKYVIT